MFTESLPELQKILLTREARNNLSLSNKHINDLGG